MRMAIAERLAGEFPLAALCRALGVSRAGLYATRAKAQRPRARQNARLAERAATLFEASGRTYGARRLAAALRRAGERCGRHRVGRIMRGRGLRAKQKRRFRPKTTDSDHLCPVAPNRLAGRPAPARPDEVWLADITYVATRQGWAYLAGVLDLFSRKVVGWAVDDTMPTGLVARAFERAVVQRRPPVGLLHHSDRGRQYASDAYRTLLHAHGVQTSMSRAGNCYDNATMESFWATLKTEFVTGRTFEDVTHLRAELFPYLEIFYNRGRLHGALGYQAPVEYEANPG